MCVPPLNSLTQFQKRNFWVQNRGGFLPKIPRMWSFFCIWRVLVFFSGLMPAEWALHHFFVSLMLQLGDKSYHKSLEKRIWPLPWQSQPQLDIFLRFLRLLIVMSCNFFKRLFKIKRNLWVQTRGGSCQKYPDCVPFYFLSLACFSRF